VVPDGATLEVVATGATGATCDGTSESLHAVDKPSMKSALRKAWLIEHHRLL